jgi:hypothetical protein
VRRYIKRCPHRAAYFVDFETVSNYEHARRRRTGTELLPFVKTQLHDKVYYSGCTISIVKLFRLPPIIHCSSFLDKQKQSRVALHSAAAPAYPLFIFP